MLQGLFLYNEAAPTHPQLALVQVVSSHKLSGDFNIL